MSTSYGTAVIQFPGFKPVKSGTTDEQLNISFRRMSRTVEFIDGTMRRLSKRERSRLFTLAKKWNRKRRPYDGAEAQPFNTLDVGELW